MDKWITGIDISKWNGVMDWQKAQDAGAEYAFIRAGSINRDTGVCYTDYQFKRNAEIAPGYMPVGFYWYLRTKWDVCKQADYFWDLVCDYPWRALVMDYELFDTTFATARERVKEFACDVVDMTQTLPAICYTRALFINHVIGKAEWMKLLDLWVARYHSGIDHPWGDGDCKPLGWDDFTFWQWSADGNGQGPTYGGQSNSMDLNRFNGTLADLERYFELVPPNEYEAEINVPQDAEVIRITLNRKL